MIYKIFDKSISPNIQRLLDYSELYFSGDRSIAIMKDAATMSYGFCKTYLDGNTYWVTVKSEYLKTHYPDLFERMRQDS